MVDDLDILVRETLEFFKSKTKEEQMEALKKEGWAEQDINFFVNGKIDKKRIQHAEKKGEIGAHEILLAVDERGEILKHILKNMSIENRVSYLVELGLSKNFAQEVANFVDELEIANKKFDQ